MNHVKQFDENLNLGQEQRGYPTSSLAISFSQLFTEYYIFLTVSCCFSRCSCPCTFSLGIDSRYPGDVRYSPPVTLFAPEGCFGCYSKPYIALDLAQDYFNNECVFGPTFVSAERCSPTRQLFPHFHLSSSTRNINAASKSKQPYPTVRNNTSNPNSLWGTVQGAA